MGTAGGPGGGGFCSFPCGGGGKGGLSPLARGRPGGGRPRRFAGAGEVTPGAARSGGHPVLIATRLADVAFGTGVTGEGTLPVVAEPVFKYRLVAVTAGRPDRARQVMHGSPRQWRWLARPSRADPGHATCRLVHPPRLPEGNVRVPASQLAPPAGDRERRRG